MSGFNHQIGRLFSVPRIEGQSVIDVGLRAMDYLSSYSWLLQLQAREASDNGKDGTEDLSAASPYSIDEPHLANYEKGGKK
jgi:hypothetical protein